MLPPEPCSSPLSGPRSSFNFLDCTKHLATNASATGHGHHCTAASSTKGQHRSYPRLGKHPTHRWLLLHNTLLEGSITAKSRVLLPNVNSTYPGHLINSPAKPCLSTIPSQPCSSRTTGLYPPTNQPRTAPSHTTAHSYTSSPQTKNHTVMSLIVRFTAALWAALTNINADHQQSKLRLINNLLPHSVIATSMLPPGTAACSTPTTHPIVHEKEKKRYIYKKKNVTLLLTKKKKKARAQAQQPSPRLPHLPVSPSFAWAQAQHPLFV